MEPRLANLFESQSATYVHGSAGRIMANIDRLEALASELVETDTPSGKFIQKMPWPAPEDSTFRVVLPVQRQSLAMLGGNLHAEAGTVLDFRTKDGSPTIINRKHEIWIDDRQPTEEERYRMLLSLATAETHGNTFQFVAAMNLAPIGGVVRLTPFTPGLAEEIFRRSLPASVWQRICNEVGRSISADRLLSGLMQVGCMTSLAESPKGMSKLLAFRPSNRVWVAAFRETSIDPVKLVQAIAVVEHGLSYPIDLREPLQNFKQKILGAIANGQIRSAWLNFDDDVWE